VPSVYITDMQKTFLHARIIKERKVSFIDWPTEKLVNDSDMALIEFQHLK